MPFKRFSSKSRRAIRPTGKKAAKKKAANVFPFKKYLTKYPGSYDNWKRYVSAYSTTRPPVTSYRRPISKPNLAPRVVDLATSTKARLTPSTFKSMKWEEEIFYTGKLQSTVKNTVNRKGIRFIWQTKKSLYDMIVDVVSKQMDRFKDLKDIPYITFDKISIKIRFYNHPVSGSKPYHGYNWDPIASMDIETPSAVPSNLEWGKSYNGKGFMSLKFNVTGFIVKNGGSPYIKLTPSIDTTALKNALRLAPTLLLYSHFPSEQDNSSFAPEAGKMVTKINYRLHHDVMKKPNLVGVLSAPTDPVQDLAMAFATTNTRLG